ncbi:MAG: 16S rRNA (uracil(1498)-N(3))-methyltransferase [Candidatus Portnoybacteria bacterium]|nr:16S rRNA (uracil(1498)-N(3))-methyltransferase [Candidatus Portnoybacteria bacterium]
MRLHHFIGDFDFADDKLKITDKEIVNQIKNVLRLGPGSRVVLGDGKSSEVLAEISEIKKDYIGLKAVEKSRNENEPERRVVLYCSILKRENFEWVVQKATEVGVAEIASIVTERTVKLNLRYDRLNRIIKEAAEQANRVVMPILREAMDFSVALEDANNNDINLFFDFSGENIKKFLDSRLCGNDKWAVEPKKIGVFIGPEGGWSEKELEMARSGKNFKIVSLGKLTLRAETAAVVASYLSGWLGG